MILAVGQSRLHRFGDVEVHPIVRDAVDKVDVAANVHTDVPTTALRPCVGAVVGGGVGSGRPWLENGSNRHWFIFR